MRIVNVFVSAAICVRLNNTYVFEHCEFFSSNKFTVPEGASTLMVLNGNKRNCRNHSLLFETKHF